MKCTNAYGLSDRLRLKPGKAKIRKGEGWIQSPWNSRDPRLTTKTTWRWNQKTQRLNTQVKTAENSLWFTADTSFGVLEISLGLQPRSRLSQTKRTLHFSSRQLRGHRSIIWLFVNCLRGDISSVFWNKIWFICKTASERTHSAS